MKRCPDAIEEAKYCDRKNVVVGTWVVVVVGAERPLAQTRLAEPREAATPVLQCQE